MESEASHRSSVSAPAPTSVHSRVLQQLEISEKSHDRYLSNTYAAIEETRSLCRFINTEGEGNTHTHRHWRPHPSRFLSPPSHTAWSFPLTFHLLLQLFLEPFCFHVFSVSIFSIIGEYI